MSLTKSCVVPNMNERGREMVSGREEKLRMRVDAWSSTKKKKKRRRRRKRGGGGGRERVLEIFYKFYFNK